jgi:uncharacterized protein (UPF0261 family)
VIPLPYIDCPKTILLFGTFDSKGDEYSYLEKLILRRGHNVLKMDVGVVGLHGALAN